jgi:8-oxo-dGTP pyrophosphatase MutT (NUDIX family)
MVWKPHVTVAAVAEQDGRFLVVEEIIKGRRVLNNPAGHLEPAESLLDAVRREALEETGWEFEPQSVIGIYLWKNGEGDSCFLRVAFSGRCLQHHPERKLDAGIVATHWLSRSELESGAWTLRSPMVLRCIDDHRAGCRYPLEMLSRITDGA